MPRDVKDEIVNGALVTDIDESMISKDVVSFALNSNLNTSDGKSYFRTNEASPELCFQTPMQQLHILPIRNNRLLVFSTDNTNSEIGIADLNTCSYTKLVESECLGFNLNYPMTSAYKENHLGEEIVTFSDNNMPVRKINLQNLPYTYTIDEDATCLTKTYTNILDCDETLFWKKISLPRVSTSEGVGGMMPNGMYSVALAYSIGGQKYSDYYGLSIPIPLFNEGGGNSLNVKIENLDQDFDEYQLVVIQAAKGTTTAKIIGNFPTHQSFVEVSNFDRNEYNPIPISTLVVTRDVYEKVGIIANTSEYLMFADLTAKEELNIQAQLSDVTAEYVVTQYPKEYYYDDGSNVGYWRDENYLFYIRYVYGTGDFTNDALILGRKATPNERGLASGADVYEALDKSITERIEVWETKNTAGKLILENNPFVENSRILGAGELGYWESTALLPDNEELFGDDACTPIRGFKMPDESKVPRYSVIDGITYVNVLGVRFKKIPHPVDKAGKPVANIKGYEILRSDRAGGNRTVVARGMMNNLRYYNENTGQRQRIAYPSYGVNYLGPDSFLSSRQTLNANNRERNYVALTEYYQNKFTFITPHAYFNNKYKMGREFIFETEETATVKGFFEEVYQHPKDGLITNFSLYLSLIIGAIRGLLETLPKIDKEFGAVASASVSGGLDYYDKGIVHDTEGNSPLMTFPINYTYNIGQIVKRVLQTLGKAGMFLFFSAQRASEVLDIIKNFSKEKNYAVQYNGEANYVASRPARDGFKRRYTVRQPEYMGSGMNTIGDLSINNFQRLDAVLVEFPTNIPNPSISGDTSVRTMSDANVDLNVKFTGTGASYYATSKVKNPSQYGEWGVARKVKTHNNIIEVTLEIDNFGNPVPYTSPVIFGGDCVIAEFSYQNKMPFFTQDIANMQLPDGTIQYDYRMYRNVGYPRYFADFSDYEMGNLITQNPTQDGLPTAKHNLNNKENSSSNRNAFTVEDRYFYLYHNTAVTYIAEADYNIWFREKVERPIYYKSNKNVSDIFRSDRVRLPEEFKLDPSFSKLQADEIYSESISKDFNSAKERVRDKNALIYSLPAFSGQKIDNWSYFLPGNYHSFNNTDFGSLTAMHKLDQDRIIFLFDKASPFILLGRDTLQSDGGRAIQIGTGGLFAQPPREVIHTDIAYGSCQSKFAFVSTPFGNFYPSARAGRLFNFTNQPEDISRNGMHFWCKDFMPIKLLEYFPDYDMGDNTVAGVGYNTVFDAKLELVYFSKRDFIPLPDLRTRITYNKLLRRFEYNGNKIELRDPSYFKEVSFTLSYSPGKGFNSWHTWYPDLLTQTETHFLASKGNKLYKHNTSKFSFGNYYGVPGSFQVQIPVNTGNQVHILEAVEYILEARTYKPNGIDWFHKLDVNFENAAIFNTEQHSGVLNMVKKPTDIYLADNYPKFNPVKGGNDITFDKVENRYRFNQFQDLVRDRGQYPPLNEINIWITSENGVDRMINPAAINYNKPVEERKRFRHYVNHIWLSKGGDTPYEMVFKFTGTKIRNAIR